MRGMSASKKRGVICIYSSAKRTAESEERGASSVEQTISLGSCNGSYTSAREKERVGAVRGAKGESGNRSVDKLRPKWGLNF